MSSYRVGKAGATVFDADGREVARLTAGQVVVEGLPDQPGSLARQHQQLMAVQRRRPTPPRQPDPRLRNPTAGSG